MEENPFNDTIARISGSKALALVDPQYRQHLGKKKGTKCKPGHKVGKKSGLTKVVLEYKKPLRDAQIIELKSQILELLTDGTCKTISEAAKKIGINPARVWDWSGNDKDFYEALEIAHQITADNIEASFLANPQWYIPNMMLLKGYRPQFRDNYKGEAKNSKLESLLEELRQVSKLPQVTIEEQKEQAKPILPEILQGGTQ